MLHRKSGIITGDHSVPLASIAVHYIQQLIAGVPNEVELFRRFIDDIIWMSASARSLNALIRQALTSAFCQL